MAKIADNRITLRFGDEDLAWIAEQAADEGVDNATMVRMIINRLRRGRQPLISMMEPVRVTPAGYNLKPGGITYVDENMQPIADQGSADELLQQRLAEIDQTGGAEVIDFQGQQEATAMPIRRVASNTLYNPRPK